MLFGSSNYCSYFFHYWFYTGTFVALLTLVFAQWIAILFVWLVYFIAQYTSRASGPESYLSSYQQEPSGEELQEFQELPFDENEYLYDDAAGSVEDEFNSDDAASTEGMRKLPTSEETPTVEPEDESSLALETPPEPRPHARSSKQYLDE